MTLALTYYDSTVTLIWLYCYLIMTLSLTYYGSTINLL